MPLIAGEHLHAEAQLVFPVLRKHGDGVGPLHAKPDHVRVERRERRGVDADQLAVDVELEVVVGDHEPGDDLAILVDLDDRQLVQVDLRETPRRDLVALVVEVGKFRPGLVVVAHRHRQPGAVLGDDLTDRILADVHPRLVDRARHQVLDRDLAEPLRDDALGRRLRFRQRQFRRRLLLLRLAGARHQSPPPHTGSRKHSARRKPAGPTAPSRPPPKYCQRASSRRADIICRSVGEWT